MGAPPSLNKGDHIRIVSPAGKIARKYVQPAIKWLNNQGYIVSLGKNVFKEENSYAGTDKQRLEDLQNALDDSNIKCIICSRGGYGTARLIDKLDFTTFINNPKWFIGFSDITVLHNQFSILKISSIHGVMPRHFLDNKGNPTESLQSLMLVLEGGKSNYSFSSNEFNRKGKAVGELIGGNLSIIYSLRGSNYDLHTEGKILFLEDLGEYLYHIDRMMTNLRLGNKLSKLAGLVVGDFSKIKDGTSPFGKNVYEIILDSVKDYSYPVYFGFPAGHSKRNLALTFGVEWELNVSHDISTLKMI